MLNPRKFGVYPYCNLSFFIVSLSATHPVKCECNAAQTPLRSALPSAVSQVEGRLRPRLFLLLTFRPWNISKTPTLRVFATHPEICSNFAVWSSVGTFHTLPPRSPHGVIQRLTGGRICFVCCSASESHCALDSGCTSLFWLFLSFCLICFSKQKRPYLHIITKTQIRRTVLFAFHLAPYLICK